MEEDIVKDIWEAHKSKLSGVGTYEDFRTAMSTPEDRKIVYDNLLSDVGDYDDFEGLFAASQKPKTKKIKVTTGDGAINWAAGTIEPTTTEQEVIVEVPKVKTIKNEIKDLSKPNQVGVQVVAKRPKVSPTVNGYSWDSGVTTADVIYTGEYDRLLKSGADKELLDQQVGAAKDNALKKIKKEDELKDVTAASLKNQDLESYIIDDTYEDFVGTLEGNGGDKRAYLEMLMDGADEVKDDIKYVVGHNMSRLQEKHPNFTQYLEDSKNLNTEEKKQAFVNKYKAIIDDPLLAEIYTFQDKLAEIEPFKNGVKDELFLDPEVKELYEQKELAKQNRDGQIQKPTGVEWADKALDTFDRNFGRFLARTGQAVGSLVSMVDGDTNVGARIIRRGEDLKDLKPKDTKYDGIAEEYKVKIGDNTVVFEDGQTENPSYVRTKDGRIKELTQEEYLSFKEQAKGKERTKESNWYVYGSMIADAGSDMIAQIITTKGLGSTLTAAGMTAKAAYATGAAFSGFAQVKGTSMAELMKIKELTQDQRENISTLMGLGTAVITSINPAEAQLASGRVSSYIAKNSAKIAAGDFSVMTMARDIVESGLMAGGKEYIEEGTEQLYEREVINPIVNNLYGTQLKTETSLDEWKSIGVVSIALGSIADVSGNVTFSKDKYQMDALMEVIEKPEIYNAYIEGMATTNPKQAAAINNAIKPIMDEISTLGADLSNSKKVEIASKMLEATKLEQEIAKIKNPVLRTSKEDQLNKLYEDIATIELGKTKVAEIVAEEDNTTAPASTQQAEVTTAKQAYDFDGTLIDNATGQLTELGQQVKERIAAGEDISIVTAREGNNTQEIQDALGINPDKIVATGDEAKKVEALNQLGISPDNYFDADQAKLDAIRGGTNTTKNDTENQTGLPSQEQVGQEPIQEKPNQEAGGETTATGGVLQTQEAVVSPPTQSDDTHNIVSASVKTNISEGRKKVIVEIDEKGNQSVKEIEFTKEDAEVELVRLEALAQRGKLTLSEFVGSYFGQSSDTGTLHKVNKNIKNDAVGFIEKLRKSFEAKSESLLSNEQSTSTTQSESNSALKDVESTAKALEGKNTALIQAPLLDKIAGNAVIGKSAKETIAEEYHKAKADGSNPELVKAVEQSLKETTKAETTTQEGNTSNVVEGSGGVGGDVESTTNVFNETQKSNPTVWQKIKDAFYNVVGKVHEGFKNTQDFIDNAINGDTQFSELAKALKDKLGDIKTSFVDDLRNKEGKLAYGKHNKDGITVSRKSPHPLQTWFHEAVHKLTVDKLYDYEEGNLHKLSDKDIEAIQNLHRIFGNVQKILNDKGIETKQHNPFKNVREFVAEALTNPEFQEILNKFKGEGKSPTLLKQFLDAVSKLLGLKDGSILDDVFHHTENLFNEGKSEQKNIAEAYHDAKSKGIENDFTKAVEQTLKETTKAGSVGVGGDKIKLDPDLANIDPTIQAARNGDKQAQKKLEEYGLDWEQTTTYRFVGQSEVDVLLSDNKVESKRFTDAGIDVTTSDKVTSAANNEYRVTFKESFDVNNGLGKVKIKSKEEGDHNLEKGRGYDINDVAKIERIDENGNVIEVLYEQSLKETTKAETPTTTKESNVVEGSVGGGDVEATAKALGGVDKDKLPLLRDIATNIQNEFEAFKKEKARLLDEKNNLDREAKDAIIKKTRYKKSEKYPDKYEFNTGASITRKTEQQLIDDYYDTKIKKIQKDEPKQGVLDMYRKQDKEFSSPQRIAEAYHKAKADGSNPELVKAVESLLSKEQTPPALRDVESTAKALEGKSSERLIPLFDVLGEVQNSEFNKQQAIDVINTEIEILPDDIRNAKDKERKEQLQQRLDYLADAKNKEKEVDDLFKELEKDSSERLLNSNKKVAEAYHKAKADGSNPELVEAVESILSKQALQATEISSQAVSTTEPEIVQNQATPEPNTSTSEAAATTQTTVLEDIGKNEAEVTTQIQKFFTEPAAGGDKKLAKEMATLNYKILEQIGKYFGPDANTWIQNKLAKIGVISTVDEARSMGRTQFQFVQRLFLKEQEESKINAEELLTKGVNRDDVFSLTGWYKTDAGDLVYEINNAEVNENFIKAFNESADYKEDQSKTFNITELVDGELFNIYPELKDFKITFIGDTIGNKEGGYTDYDNKEIGIRYNAAKSIVGLEESTPLQNGESTHKQLLGSIITHELQHAVQFIDGRDTRADNDTGLEKVRAEIEADLKKQGVFEGLSKSGQETRVDNELQLRYGNARTAGYFEYRKLPAESEARVTQSRGVNNRIGREFSITEDYKKDRGEVYKEIVTKSLDRGEANVALAILYQAKQDSNVSESTLKDLQNVVDESGVKFQSESATPYESAEVTNIIAKNLQTELKRLISELSDPNMRKAKKVSTADALEQKRNLQKILDDLTKSAADTRFQMDTKALDAEFKKPLLNSLITRLKSKGEDFSVDVIEAIKNKDNNFDSGNVGLDEAVLSIIDKSNPTFSDIIKVLKATSNDLEGASTREVISYLNSIGDPEIGRIAKELIKFQEDAATYRAAVIETAKGKMILAALNNPNASSFIHETNHLFSNDLEQADKGTLIKAYNDAFGEKETSITTDVSEYAARMWEKYFSNGRKLTGAEVTNPETRADLQNIFDKFTNWLKAVYNGVINYTNTKGVTQEVKVSKEVQALFDKIMGIGVTPAAEPVQTATTTEDVIDADDSTTPIANITDPNDPRLATTKFKTSGKLVNEQIDSILKQMGKAGFAETKSQSFRQALNIANEQGLLSPGLLSETEVMHNVLLNKGFTTYETIALQRALSKLLEDIESNNAEINEAGGEEKAPQALIDLRDSTVDRYELFALAYKKTGTESGRALAYRRLADVSLFNSVVMKKRLRAEFPNIDTKVMEALESLVDQIEAKTKELQELESKIDAEKAAMLKDKAVEGVKTIQRDNSKPKKDPVLEFKKFFSEQTAPTKILFQGPGGRDAAPVADGYTEEQKFEVIKEFARHLVRAEGINSLEKLTKRIQDEYESVKTEGAPVLTNADIFRALALSSKSEMNAKVREYQKNIANIRSAANRFNKIATIIDGDIIKTKKAKPKQDDIVKLDKLITDLQKVFWSDDLGLNNSEQNGLMDDFNRIREALNMLNFSENQEQTDTQIDEIRKTVGRINSQLKYERLEANLKKLQENGIPDTKIKSLDKLLDSRALKIKEQLDELRIELKAKKLEAAAWEKLENKTKILGIKLPNTFFGVRRPVLLYNLNSVKSNFWEYARRYPLGGDLGTLTLQGGFFLYNTLGSAFSPSILTAKGRQKFALDANTTKLFFKASLESLFKEVAYRKKHGRPNPSLDMYHDMMSTDEAATAKHFGVILNKPFAAQMSKDENELFANKGIGDLKADSKIAQELILMFDKYEKISEGAYTMGLNILRLNMFNSFRIMNENATPDELRQYADEINKQVGTYGKFGGALSKIFTAPRLYWAKIKMLADLPSATIDLASPEKRLVAKERIKASMHFALGQAMMGGLIALLGFEYEDDPRDKDFLKWKKGTTTVDITAGIGKWASLAASIPMYADMAYNNGKIGDWWAGDHIDVLKALSGDKDAINLSARKGVDVLDEFKQLNGKPWNLFVNRISYSLHPTIRNSFAMLQAEDGIGKPLATSWGKRVWNGIMMNMAPISMQDALIMSNTVMKPEEKDLPEKIVELGLKAVTTAAQFLGTNVQDAENNLKHVLVENHFNKLGWDPVQEFTSKEVIGLIPELAIPGQIDVARQSIIKMLRTEVQNEVGTRILEDIAANNGESTLSADDIADIFAAEGERVAEKYREYYKDQLEDFYAENKAMEEYNKKLRGE